MRIPKLKTVEGFDSVLIEENGEKLVNMKGLNPKIHVKPVYSGSTLLPSGVFVREKISEKLVIVANSLPEGTNLILWDGWRPLELQNEIYLNYLESLIAVYPRLSFERLELLAEEFVARPSSNQLKPSPHVTGGSVSVALCNTVGDLLPLGTDYGAVTPKAHTRYYEEILSDDNNFRVAELRRKLFNAMVSQGFTNFSNAWWHFDYGNQYWGKIKGENAKYGYVESF